MSNGLELSLICQPMFAVWSGLTIAGLSAGSCMFSRAVAAGAIARRNMGLRQRFITGLCAGRDAASGKTCFESLLETDDPRARR